MEWKYRRIMFTIIYKIKTRIIHIISLYDWKIGPTHKAEKSLLKQYYNLQDHNNQQRTVVFMIDGREKHGGLADRFRSICTIYHWCEKNNVPFKLHYTSPFNLEDYLIPNQVDWICHKPLSYNKKYSRPVILFDYLLPMKYHEQYLSRLWHHCKQSLHLYTYSFFAMDTYQKDFYKLFKPCKRLQREIDAHIENIGSPYIAVVTRFQQLLGDFNEGNFKTLEPKERTRLIELCVNKIKEIHLRDRRKILCTSDSYTFLNEVAKLDFVYTIPGKVVHIDYDVSASYDTYLKSFLDFYMIGHADFTHLLVSGDMYRSGFPGAAAQSMGKPWDIIEFDEHSENIIKG